MKKFLFFSVVCGFLFVSSVHGDEDSSQSNESMQPVRPIHEKNPHHIYFGPEAFWFDVNTHVKNIKIDDLKFFLGLRLRYDYLKPKAFYAGVDLLSAGSTKGFRAHYHGHHFPRDKGITGFGNFEVRFGYTFAPKNEFVTPYLAMGSYGFQLGRHYRCNFKESMVYYAGGVRGQYEITPLFSLGLNLKVFRTNDTDKKFKHSFMGGRIKRTEHHNMWGGEIGVPFIWRVGSTKRWDIQLEPYFLKLEFSEVQNIYGTRLLFGYRF